MPPTATPPAFVSPRRVFSVAEDGADAPRCRSPLERTLTRQVDAAGGHAARAEDAVRGAGGDGSSGGAPAETASAPGCLLPPQAATEQQQTAPARAERRGGALSALQASAWVGELSAAVERHAAREREHAQLMARIDADANAKGASKAAKAKKGLRRRGKAAAALEKDAKAARKELRRRGKADRMRAKVAPPVQAHSLGALAVSAVAVQLRKSVKLSRKLHRGEPDDELVHDARVALRRLRTAVRQFGPFMRLPEGAGVKPLSRALRVLGAVRDADVMLETLEIVAGDAAMARAPKEEERALKELRKKIRRSRKRALARVGTPGATAGLDETIANIEAWARRPDFETSLAHWPADLAAPQLLLERARAAMQHPAWKTTLRNLQAAADSDHIAQLHGHSKEEKHHMAVMGVDPRHAAHLHELRKNLRELRYSLELMAPVYAHQEDVQETYQRALKTVMRHQELLGILQDLDTLGWYVASDWKLAKRMPSLQTALRRSYRRVYHDFNDARKELQARPGSASGTPLLANVQASSSDKGAFDGGQMFEVVCNTPS